MAAIKACSVFVKGGAANAGSGTRPKPCPAALLPPNRSQGLTAIAPISTATSRGRRATCTVARAGVTPVK